jgi:hypothetical protein
MSAPADVPPPSAIRDCLEAMLTEPLPTVKALERLRVTYAEMHQRCTGITSRDDVAAMDIGLVAMQLLDLIEKNLKRPQPVTDGPRKCRCGRSRSGRAQEPACGVHREPDGT